MAKEISIVVSPEVAASEKSYTQVAARELGISINQIASVRVKRQSIDARGRTIKVNLTLMVYVDDEREESSYRFEYRDVRSAPEVILVGSGPASLFAALRLIELGLRPIILERGKDVHSRKIDLAQINRNEVIDADSNYCFGEGGAGTYSDGKLFTRSKKRGDCTRALHILYNHGSAEEILYQAHPHIGTNKLPTVIENIRNTIIHWGGEVHFGCRVTDLILKDNRLLGVVTEAGERIMAQATILATGHSARDIYELLHRKGVILESKPYAMGVRVEHPQELIDSIQYKMPHRGEYLPAAAYTLVSQVNGRGAYSFCMCPGGFIVPAGVRSGESVVNGMSPSQRNSKFANSGIVTEIRESDFAHLLPEYGVLAGLKYQQQFEELAFANGGGAQIVPAQRLTDFIRAKHSSSLGVTSYHPGMQSSNMREWMPEVIYSSLKGGFEAFGAKMRGFVTEEAMVLGVESRTSSPVRVPRDKETLEHIQIKGLFPAGEGAGYAGGIISAGIDGERVAESIANFIKR
ncbi:MAG: FAD-binding protein [Rikenellaceae bacterium]